jgi:alpha-ketoglutarate-dependent taurine dioxygenase
VEPQAILIATVEQGSLIVPEALVHGNFADRCSSAIRNDWSVTEMSKLEVRDLHPGFGVEVSGVEPRIPLDDGTIAELKRLFDDKGLVVIRGIDADLPFQNYLSRLLIGENPLADGLEALGTMPGGRELLVSNKEPGGNAPVGRLLFHSDYMWSENVFRLLSLYGVEVEEPSTPTMFVSAVHAWETLPDDLRARVEGRFAIHGQDATYQQRAGGDADVLVANFQDEETIRLPIGYSHPRTGRTLLYAAQQMTQRIDDMPEEESEALLEELFQHLYRDENVVAHYWRKGDLVLWDNIALQHARPNVTSEGPARTLRKVFAPVPKMIADKRPQFTTVGA